MSGVIGTSGVIHIYPDRESLSCGAATLFAQQAGRALKDRGRFTVALSGGHTPLGAYELLAQPPFRDRVAWDQTHVFWGDERCVPSEDPRNNARVARLLLLERVPIPPSQIHPISCDRSPKEAAQEYEDLLRSFFDATPPCFDLILLGLGEDGHTASLFPHAPILTEGKRWVTEVKVPQQELYRVTLTPPVINQAAVVAFLVAGVAKAQILKDVLEGRKDPFRFPAQLIRPSSGTIEWLADRGAASQLSRAAAWAGLETAIFQRNHH